MKLFDARSGKVVAIGETVRYPRTVYRPDGSSYEGPNEDWTLLSIGAPSHVAGLPRLLEEVPVSYRDDATGRVQLAWAPVHGWWIWKYAVMPT